MTYRMEEMTWPEFAAKKDRVVILPVGAVEQHALHLPICTDAVIAEQFALRLAEKIDGVVMPPLSYGYKSKPLSGGGPLFPGTIDLNGETVIRLVYDVLMELVRDGFTKIFIMNAHFENEAFLVEAMDLVNRDTKGAALLVESNWWDPLSEEVIEKIFDQVPFPGWAFEHAAVTETSLMMYFAPQLCHLERMTEAEPAEALPYFRYPLKKGDVPETGALASAYSSSSEKGEQIVAAVIPELVNICLKEMPGD
ncbi:creatininase [Lactonifactor sp. BIOML-A3]|uniref:creatininase n=1 Tax=unclassified Lactonifactor TaxID=2636670 RepID=UPI0012AF58C8|nr:MULTISPECIES: creatininase [unclassified Lactonifactor]MSA00100.1 creatininase [Lactonifactor sp. BIOML-A5]MSA06727.1 creatininase [Lactonifactor sp. BIOML-A4]MSA10945.1 creatininase [Lactonifactor sp. BIOML-A3]MSA15959.1 creatininase [Lactonifactor sp. BIOML-A2]MSA36563.1 creatininase [Lactonifactor sp. BIOML-A1]